MSKGLSVAVMSFPDYGTSIGKEIRKFLNGVKGYPQEVRAMLYAANRWEKKKELEASLSTKDATIVDRYTPSNLAYGLSKGLELAWLLSLERGLPEPDLVLLLDAPPGSLVRRLASKRDTYEADTGLQKGARKAYLRLARNLGWKVVDAAGGRATTAHMIQELVSRALAGRGQTV
jgi:dTMP kinase